MPPRDQFPNRSAGASPRQWFAITPSDDDDLEQIPQAIWVGTGGDLAVMGSDDNVEVIPDVPGGEYWIGSPTRVMEEGTTATGLVGAV